MHPLSKNIVLKAALAGAEAGGKDLIMDEEISAFAKEREAKTEALTLALTRLIQDHEMAQYLAHRNEVPWYGSPQSYAHQARQTLNQLGIPQPPSVLKRIEEDEVAFGRKRLHDLPVPGTVLQPQHSPEP